MFGPTVGQDSGIPREVDLSPSRTGGIESICAPEPRVTAKMTNGPWQDVPGAFEQPVLKISRSSATNANERAASKTLLIYVTGGYYPLADYYTVNQMAPDPDVIGARCSQNLDWPGQSDSDPRRVEKPRLQIMSTDILRCAAGARWLWTVLLYEIIA